MWIPVHIGSPVTPSVTQAFFRMALPDLSSELPSRGLVPLGSGLLPSRVELGPLQGRRGSRSRSTVKSSPGSSGYHARLMLGDSFGGRSKNSKEPPNQMTAKQCCRHGRSGFRAPFGGLSLHLYSAGIRRAMSNVQLHRLLRRTWHRRMNCPAFVGVVGGWLGWLGGFKAFVL